MPVLAYVPSVDVEVIDTSTNTVIGTFVAGANPSGVAITPNGNFVFVTNNFSNDVTVTDTSNNRHIAYIRVGELPEGIAITPNGRFAYVANIFSDNVSVINVITLTVVAIIPVGHFPEGVAISPNGNFAYVTNAMSNNVSVIDTSTNTVITTIPVGAFPISIAASPENLIYVCNEDDKTISVIDFFTNKVIDTIHLNGVPSNLAVRPNRQYVYVTIGDLNIVDIIFTGNNSVVATVEVGSLPLGIAFTPDGNFAYVTNLGSSDISVIDAASNTVVDIIPVYAPMNIAIANVPKSPTPSPSGKMCIETTRIYDSCAFEEEQQKTFNLPNSIEDQCIHCKVTETKYSILDITKIDEQQDLINVKLRIEAILGFISNCSNDPIFKKVVYFDKSITLIAPEGSDVSCDINTTACECIQSNCGHTLTCIVKIVAVVKSKKLVQFQVPFLGNCEPSSCSSPCNNSTTE